MRGKLPADRDLRRAPGLIPAHAGKTSRCVAPRRIRPAHPRACGENHLPCDDPAKSKGSSPRMRGKRNRGVILRHRARLIPAHAGKTQVWKPEGFGTAAHPRACGENPRWAAYAVPREGSSPRMRGKHDSMDRRRVRIGLIPAHAGKTRLEACSGVQLRAHPRACGENGWHVFMGTSPRGSSPRMRGKPLMLNTLCLNPRLIPAHAGKTYRFISIASHMGAHPRACGENLLLRESDRAKRGSSPRMRGKRAIASNMSWSAGLIPAHAGKTKSLYLRPYHREAHPRACGENPRGRACGRCADGSSPRMRGKH